MKKIRSLIAVSCFTTAVASAAIINEDFSTDPSTHGWKNFGNPTLFLWNATNQNLEVTWDSSQPNSYFYIPLGTVLAADDAFSVGFDLIITDVPVANGFELALGLLNFHSATNAGFFRGSGSDSPDLAEFDYFPDFSSPSLTTVDTNGVFNFLFGGTPLIPGATYRVELFHDPGAPVLAGQIASNGVVIETFPVPYTSTNFADFRLDTFSVSS